MRNFSAYKRNLENADGEGMYLGSLICLRSIFSSIDNVCNPLIFYQVSKLSQVTQDIFKVEDVARLSKLYGDVKIFCREATPLL